MNIFSLFCHFLPFVKDREFHFNKPEAHSSKDAFTKLVVLEKKILNFVNVFLLFHNHLLSEKGGSIHLNSLVSSLV